MTAVGSLGSGAPDRYPVLLDLAGRAALVVGGGPVAARRAAGLRAAGAQVTVIAPGICEDLVDLVAEGAVVWLPREATADDVTAGPEVTGANPPAESDQPIRAAERAELVRGTERAEPVGAAAASERAEPVGADLVADPRWWLVHTATGDQLVDEAIAERAHIEGIWCVRADRAEDSAAHIPALAHGPDGVQVAVSGGGDPGRARAIRDAISDLLATGALPLRRTRTRTRHPRRPRRPRIASGSSGSRRFEPDAIRSDTQQTRRDFWEGDRACRARGGWAGGSRADHRLREAVAGPG